MSEDIALIRLDERPELIPYGLGKLCCTEKVEKEDFCIFKPYLGTDRSYLGFASKISLKKWHHALV